MSKYKKAKGRNKGSRHIQLWENMHESEAWRSLSLAARCVWLEVMKRFRGSNNGDIPLSCREAAEYCLIGKSTAKRAFDELIEKGFLKIGMYSSFTYKKKRSRRWIITHYPYDDKAPTNEWKKWKNPKVGANTDINGADGVPLYEEYSPKK